MKAISFADFGPANQVLKVSDWPTPAPGPGEVLVKLHTTGVNPSDVKKRAGGFPNLLDDGAVIPHSDGAGVIEGVGACVRDNTGRKEFIEGMDIPSLTFPSDHAVVSCTVRFL